MENKVTVWCMVFNHEKFLRKCLDGFIMQKTNFPFEVIIHDDASTDHSADIIREYERKYPNLIKPIYEKENQYSIGRERIGIIQLKNLTSKYFAICEGDDYWNSPDKLQKQYDYMELHPECSMCLHNTIIHDLSHRKSDELFFPWKNIHKLTEDEIFFGWHVHTSSYFIRTNSYIDIPKKFLKVWCGDYVYLTYIFTKGEIVALPEVMSVYNYANPLGVTMQNCKNFTSVNMALVERKKYLYDLIKSVDEEYAPIIKKRIYELSLEIDILLYKFKFNILSQNQRISIRQSITQNQYYPEWKASQGGKTKIFSYFNYENKYIYMFIDFFDGIKKYIKNKITQTSHT